MASETDDLELKELGQYRGTEHYYKSMGMTHTDGVAYIMQNGYSWFVTDSIVILNMKLKDEEFCSVKLKVNKNKTAQMTITDGNNKILYKQAYKYTDAKVDVEMFCTNGVLMLTGEY